MPPVSPRATVAIRKRARLVYTLEDYLDQGQLSRFHAEHPYVFNVGGQEYRVGYVPGESDTGMFGGNSNWRGPIWMPVNFLLVEALERYHYFYGDTLKVECPTGSGNMMTLDKVARHIASRLAGIFLPDAKGRRPMHGASGLFATDLPMPAVPTRAAVGA